MTQAYPLPSEAQDDRLAIVGNTGSGKTYAAGTVVERILNGGNRVIIADPLGVWWGLRLLADGKTPSRFNVVIFGGAHGDLPITEHSGAVIGETVAGMAESCILDLSGLGTKAAERRFMLAFLTALYRKTTGEPVHVVFDEADMWAPQRLMDRDGDAAKLQGMMETIVRRGRVKGFIPILITQRPAVLSKDVLSQADGLVAMKLTSSQDRDAIGDWVQGQADKAEWRRIWQTLPSLNLGIGLVWIPGRQVMKLGEFPQKETFDSSRTPKRGEKKRAAALQPLNLASLKERLATVETEAKENDPKALRAEVARLRKDLLTASHKDVPPSKQQLEDAWQEGFKSGHAVGVKEGKSHCTDVMRKIRDIVTPALEDGAALMAKVSAREGLPTPPVPQPAPVKPQHRAIVASSSPGEDMPGPQRKLLTVLAQFPDGRTKKQLAILAGYSHNGGAFNNPLSNLRARGWATGNASCLKITPAGLGALGSYEPLPTGAALREHWYQTLEGPAAKLLRVLCEHYPNSMTKTELAAAAGYQPTGGAFNNPLSRLRSLELVTGYGGAPLRASDDLF